MADGIVKPRAFGTGPEGAEAELREIGKRLGFVPNLISTFANSSAVLGGYLGLDRAWNRTSFSSRERQIILLAASSENSCRYCAAVYTMRLKAMRVDAGTVAAIRNRAPLAEPKWNALVAMTREIVGGRGFVAEKTKRDFLAAGYSAIALMELIVGIALATMGNYLDHLSPIPIDPAFAAEAR